MANDNYPSNTHPAFSINSNKTCDSMVEYTLPHGSDAFQNRFKSANWSKVNCGNSLFLIDLNLN